MRNANARMYLFLGSLLGVHICVAAFGPARAQTPEFMAPPRTIADITAILDQEKPDSAVLARNKAAADAEPPRGARPAALHKFYLERGFVRAELGYLREAREDAERALKVGGGLEFKDLVNARNFVVLQHINAGEFKVAHDLLASLERDVANAGVIKGRLFSIYRWTIYLLVARGDLTQAEGYLRRLQALFAEAQRWSAFAMFGSHYKSEVERAKATLADAKGQFREAEIAYGRSASLVRDAIGKMSSWPPGHGTTKDVMENRIDLEISLRGRAKAKQGRLAEAEADIRAALLSRLKSQGKYAVTTSNKIGYLADVIALQGRYAEAEQLGRAALDIRRLVGVAPDAEVIVGSLRRLSSLATLQQRHQAAAKLDTERQ